MNILPRINETLYHGTIDLIASIDVTKGRGNKDFGKVGTDDAKEILMKNLEVENLGIQYYIGKQEIADKLIISIKEL